MHALLTQSVGVTVSVSTPGPLLTSSLPRANWSVAGQPAPVAVAAAREVEHGEPDAWRRPLPGAGAAGDIRRRAARGARGADGTVGDLCAMVEEAAAAMVPGPVATTALATLLIGDPHVDLLEALASGERTAGVAATADFDYDGGRVSGTAEVRARRRRGRAAPAACR